MCVYVIVCVYGVVCVMCMGGCVHTCSNCMCGIMCVHV